MLYSMLRPIHLLIFLLLLCAAAIASDPLINKDSQGVAIGGYDPVAYFVSARATPGDPAIHSQWQGATWYFATPENRKQFIANPDRFVPRYGGFCAYAASLGAVSRTDPEAWTIIDDRLYLNFSTKIRDTWRAGAKEFIGDANILWPDIVKNHAE